MSTSSEANLSVDPQRTHGTAEADAGGEAKRHDDVGSDGSRVGDVRLDEGGRSLLNLRASTGQFPVLMAGLGERSLIDRFLARNNEELLARYAAEHGEPSIWIWRRVVGGAFAFIAFTLMWYLLKMPSGLISDEALPTQTQVATAFKEVRADGFAGSSLVRHIGISLFRLTLGLGFGSMAGVALGLVTGAAPMARTIIDPIASFFRMVPGLALGPLLLIWFGAGERATIGVVALTVMWATMGSASDARARSLRGMFTDLPLEVIAGMRAALLVAWATVLAIETVVASSGLGAMIWFAQGRSDVIVLGIYVAGLLGFALDTALRGTEYFLANSPGD